MRPATALPATMATLLAVLLAVLLIACTSEAPASPSPDPMGTPATSPSPGGTLPGGTPATSPAPTSGATPAPSPTGLPPAPPTPVPPVVVNSPAQAAALVLDSDPRFYGLMPPRADMIGQCCWYIAFPAIDHYLVTVELGWDDCPSGCISSHRWIFRVDRNATITLLEEEGDEPVGVGPPLGAGPAQATLEAKMGPICPVQPFPPDPACVPPPVAGAEMIIFEPAGTELERGTTDENGQLVVALEPGAYFVVALPVEGMLRAPEPVAFSVAAGGRVQLTLEYDTGIR